jgi:excisionase family DNA binding protein
VTTTTATKLNTPVEASERLPYCARYLVTLARQGRIGHTRIGRKVLFSDEHIEDCIANGLKEPHSAEAKPTRNPKYDK